MSIGPGGHFSFLTWVDEVANTGAHSTCNLDNGEVTAWLYSGAYSELKPGRAKEAAREYLRTGQQPTGVAWAA